MKKFLVFVVATFVLVAGGVYFTAETVILPRQEKVWRALLEDLPYELQADFEDVDFDLAGLRLSIGGATLRDGKNALKVSEIVAQNSVRTAMGNLVRFVLGREEENYDVVRFIGIEPLDLQEGIDLKIREIRLLNVAIGIDNKLPTTMKTLTGAVNLDDAFAAGKFDGFEVHGVVANAQGISTGLDWMKVHGITKTNLELVEVSGLRASQGGQATANLDMFRTRNFNIAMIMEPKQVVELAAAAENDDLSAFNIFHSADELVLVGLDIQVPGIGGLAVKRMMYAEEESEIVANAGIVPTRTFSEVRNFDLAFPGLAALSPGAGLFMQTTGINSLLINSETDGTWDVAGGILKSGGRLDLDELARFTAALELGGMRPQELVRAITWGRGLTGNKDAMGETVMNGLMSAYGDITLNDLDYFIENKSLIDRLYRFADTALGTPEGGAKATLDAQLAAALQNPELPASMVDDLTALRAFFADPKNLRIVMEPPNPVSINGLAAQQDPEKAADMLGLRITANEGTDSESL